MSALYLCEYEYLCRLIEKSTSLLSSMKMLAADALIIVKLLSLTDTHCWLDWAEGSTAVQKHAFAHTHTPSLWSLLAAWHVFQLSSIFLRPLIKHRSKTEPTLSSHTRTDTHLRNFLSHYVYVHDPMLTSRVFFSLLIKLMLACMDWK